MRPHVICHMTTSIDGKVTGKFLETPQGLMASDEYYRVHRDFHADAFACGRITMEGSFTGGWYPDLKLFEGGPFPGTIISRILRLVSFVSHLTEEGALAGKSP